MTQRTMPTYEEIAAPTLQGLELRGGSASIHELSEDVAVLMDVPDEILEVPHGEGSRSEFDYRAAWTRTYLKNMGAINNSSRGIWSLTEYGRSLDPATDFRREFRTIGRGYAKQSQGSLPTTNTGGSDEGDAEEDQALPSPGDSGDRLDEASEEQWQDTLLATLRDMSPDGFERLCRRLLLESGFTKVEVTGRSGDGGIDGVGVLRIELISFQIVFQCKRYTGSVGAGAIREFRGSLMGRADKGLFLTTGRFTHDAQREAVRDGAAAIDLIAGTELCQLLKELDLGVETEMVEEVTVDPEFFDSI